MNPQSIELSNGTKVLLRLFTSDDFDSFINLFHTVYKPNRDEKLTVSIFRWKMLQHKHPNDNVFVVAATAADNQLVGIYGGIPLNLMIAGESYLTSFVIASSVRPSYRGRYLFQKMVTAYRETLQARRTLFFGGFANNDAYKIGLRSLSYRKILSIRRYIKPLTFYALVFHRDRQLWLKLFLLTLSFVITPFLSLKRWSYKKTPCAIEILPTNNLPEDYDAFLEEANKKYEILAFRNKEYMQWRFFERKELNYKFHEARIEGKLIGYFILKTQCHTTDIVDFFCIRKEKILNSLFYSMMRFICQQRSWWIRFRISDDEIEKLLAAEIFYVDDTSNFGIVNVYSDSLFFENMLRPASWYLTNDLYEIG